MENDKIVLFAVFDGEQKLIDKLPRVEADKFAWGFRLGVENYATLSAGALRIGPKNECVKTVVQKRIVVKAMEVPAPKK